MTIADRIKARRKELGMTQEQLAQACGLKRVSITNWESGKTAPSQVNLQKLVKALDVPSAAYFYDGSDDEILELRESMPSYTFSSAPEDLSENGRYQTVDMELLRGVLVAMEASFSALKISLSPSKTADFFLRFYHEEAGKIDRGESPPFERGDEVDMIRGFTEAIEEHNNKVQKSSKE